MPKKHTVVHTVVHTARFADLQRGVLYRFIGAWHVWDGQAWAGAGGIAAGVYVGLRDGKYLFEDTDQTYGVTDTSPRSSRIEKVKVCAGARRAVWRVAGNLA